MNPAYMIRQRDDRGQFPSTLTAPGQLRRDKLAFQLSKLSKRTTFSLEGLLDCALLEVAIKADICRGEKRL